MKEADKDWSIPWALFVGASLLVALILAGHEVYQYVGSKYANADREIHTKSTSFVQGTIQNVQRYKLEYDTAENEAHRSSIRQIVLIEVSSLDETKLPPHLQEWVKELRRAK
jgi:hypothetical protein